MKLTTALSIALLTISSSSLADDSNYLNPGAPTQDSTKQLTKYFLNLGSYLGPWNLKETKDTKGYNSKAFDDVYDKINATILGFVSNIPLASLGTDAKLFYSMSNGSDALQEYLNQTFPNYGTATKFNKNGIEKVNALKGYDQSSFMPSPSEQNVQDLLSSPPSTISANITSYDALSAALNKPCSDNANCVYPFWQLSNGGGIPFKNSDNPLSYPSLFQLSSGSTNQQLVPSLSFDSLVGPLVYVPNAKEDTGGSDSDDKKSSNLGLFGKDPATQADSFIRYASGSVLPLAKPSLNDYNALIKTITNKSTPVAQKAAGVAQLNAYRLMLRSYAAQTSVGVSNLYHLMGKRMVNKKNNSASQAELEFQMATSRLASAKKSGAQDSQSDWLTNLKQATPAEVQRQTAILLAEMNYQLYLSRMSQERLLATMSVLQLQLLAQLKNSVSLGNAGGYLTSSSLGSAGSSN